MARTYAQDKWSGAGTYVQYKSHRRIYMCYTGCTGHIQIVHVAGTRPYSKGRGVGLQVIGCIFSFLNGQKI
jgi:hypothetical protein